jgi:hypothetical protein
MFTRKVRNLHAECNNRTQCNFDTHKYNHDCDLTRTRVISKCDVCTESAIFTRRVRFSHAELNFYTQIVIATRSVILTRTNEIKKLITVISTRTRVIFTRRV